MLDALGRDSCQIDLLDCLLVRLGSESRSRTRYRDVVRLSVGVAKEQISSAPQRGVESGIGCTPEHPTPSERAQDFAGTAW